MFKLKQSIRIISRMKSYTALSVLGLVISLSGTVIIGRYLHQEWTADSFMPDLDRTYILGVRFTEGARSDRPYETGMPFEINNEEGFISPVEGQSEVERYTTIALRHNYSLRQADGQVIYPDAIAVDSVFDSIYPIDIVEGTAHLVADGQCIISTELAERISTKKGESMVGKTFEVGDGELNTVVGVYRKPRCKTSICFDLANYRGDDPWVDNALNMCLVLTYEGADIEAYNNRQPIQSFRSYMNQPLRYLLVPYHDMMNMVNSEDTDIEHRRSTSSVHLWMLLGVAVMLLLVGVFNFVNLYAVMRAHRSHEMHVRRIFGASRWSIFTQLYIETFLLALLTMLGVWIVVEITSPLLATYYDINVIGQWKFDALLTLAFIFALPMVSSVPSVSSVSSVFSVSSVSSVSSVLFLFLQFFISLALLNVSIYFMRQLHVMMTADPGFRTERLLSALIYPEQRMSFPSAEDWMSHMQQVVARAKVIRQKLDDCPYIQNITVDPMPLTEGSHISTADGQQLCLFYVDRRAMDMYGLEMVKGRAYNDSTDNDQDYNMILNETAARRLGINNLDTDLVQLKSRIWFDSQVDMNYNPPYHVVGIVRDFNFGRTTEPVQPAVFFFSKGFGERYDEDGVSLPQGEYMLIDVAPGHEDDMVAYLKDMMQEVFDTDELKYSWVTDRRNKLYSEDQRTARVFITFSLLAIAVTCLGVLGLMMFDIRRRYREIALRKVNGATLRDIALLLTRRYITILAIAAAASIPVALLVVHRLMESYTTHTTFAWWIPLLSIAILVTLCTLTLWWQILKAMRIKPYKVLKEQ